MGQQLVQALAQVVEVTGLAEVGRQPQRQRRSHAGPVHALADEDARQLPARRPAAYFAQQAAAIETYQFAVGNQQQGSFALAGSQGGVAIMHLDGAQLRTQ